jgi:hypothetical protein
MQTLVRTTSPRRPYLNVADVLARISVEEGPTALLSGFVSTFTFSSAVIVLYYNSGVSRM